MCPLGGVRVTGLGGVAFARVVNFTLSAGGGGTAPSRGRKNM